MVKACEFLYKDRRQAVRQEYRKKLEEHMKNNNKESLLSAAIDLAEWKEAKEQLVILASAMD